MKTYLLKHFKVITCIGACGCAGIAFGQSNKPAESSISDLIKSGDDIIGTRINNENVVVPKGSIAIGVSALSESSIQIAEIVNMAPAGNDGRQAAWFKHIVDVLEAINVVISTKLQMDLFKVIRPMSSVLSAVDPDSPMVTLNSASDALKNLSVTITKAFSQYVNEQSGIVPIDTVRVFVDAFKTEGFIGEPDWEDEVMPIDPAGVFILDPTYVVGYLKAQPLQMATQFLGGQDSASAFRRYAADGDGLAVLRSRYGANQAVIVAKWNELTTWVEQQRPPEQ